MRAWWRRRWRWWWHGRGGDDGGGMVAIAAVVAASWCRLCQVLGWGSSRTDGRRSDCARFWLTTGRFFRRGGGGLAGSGQRVLSPLVEGGVSLISKLASDGPSDSLDLTTTPWPLPLTHHPTLTPHPDGLPQVLRPPSAARQELPQEEVRPHQPASAEEEVEIDAAGAQALRYFVSLLGSAGVVRQLRFVIMYVRQCGVIPV